LKSNKKNLPGVIIVGAQKCGTTTLHHTLSWHSKIAGPISPETGNAIKEVNFFCNDSKWEKGIDWYKSHFINANYMHLDSSPNYLCLPSCFPRLKEVVPNAKLIVCLRNPVQRAFSQYNHYKQKLPESAIWDWLYPNDFSTSVEKYLARNWHSIDDYTNFSGLLLRGVYFSQIKQLLKHFKRDNIHFTILEKWAIDYDAEVDKVVDFLNLKREILPNHLLHKREYGEEVLDLDISASLKRFYKPHNERLFELLGYEINEW
jgi:hypothetical protein